MTPLPAGSPRVDSSTILEVRELSIYRQHQPLLQTLNLAIPANHIVALIGPSGSGKSILLRCFNRLNDLIPQLRIRGQILYRGHNLYDPHWAVTSIRRHIGMIFPHPHPLPKSIYENVAFGVRLSQPQGNGQSPLDEIVESALRQVNLWDAVKDQLSLSALTLTMAQQQQLCLARAIAVEPTVLLIDDSTSTLDTPASRHLEELFSQLKHRYTLIMATHDPRQAARISDYTAFLATQPHPQGHPVGYLVEYAPTRLLFQQPQEQLTHHYLTGRLP